MVDFYFTFFQKSRTDESAAKTKRTAESSGTHSSRKSASKKVSNKPKVCEITNYELNWKLNGVGKVEKVAVVFGHLELVITLYFLRSPNPHAGQILEVMKIKNWEHWKSKIVFCLGEIITVWEGGRGVFQISHPKSLLMIWKIKFKNLEPV